MLRITIIGTGQYAVPPRYDDSWPISPEFKLGDDRLTSPLTDRGVTQACELSKLLCHNHGFSNIITSTALGAMETIRPFTGTGLITRWIQEPALHIPSNSFEGQSLDYFAREYGNPPLMQYFQHGNVRDILTTYGQEAWKRVKHHIWMAFHISKGEVLVVVDPAHVAILGIAIHAGSELGQPGAVEKYMGQEHPDFNLMGTTFGPCEGIILTLKGVKVTKTEYLKDKSQALQMSA